MTEEVANEATQDPVEETHEEGGLVDTTGQTTETVGDLPIPEGLDSDIFDAETRTLKESAVVERLKQNQEDINRWKKQANDMRRKLSKGVDAPEDVKEYAEQFVPEERYEFIIGETETDAGKHVNQVLEILDGFAFEHGLSIETAKDLKNLYLRYTEDVKITDARTEEQKAEEKAGFILEQKKLLGENAEKIISDNVKFFKEYGFFNDSEKKELLSAMDKSAVWNSIGHKIRTLFGQNPSNDIPVRGVNVSGLADDATLAKEYYSTSTSDTRRMQILQARIDAGRSGGLPMPD